MPTVEIYYFKSVWNWEGNSLCLQHEGCLRHYSFLVIHKYFLVFSQKPFKNAEVFTQASQHYRTQNWQEVIFGKLCAYPLEGYHVPGKPDTHGAELVTTEGTSKAGWAVD